MDLIERSTTRPPPEPAYRTLVRLRRALRWLTERLLPADAVVIERTLAALEIRAMGVAARLGLASALSRGPKTSRELADTLGVPADRLERLLGLLRAAGVVRRRPRHIGRWTLTRLGSVLDPSHPRSASAWASFFGGSELFRLMTALEDAVLGRGSATTLLHDADFFSWLASDPETGARFDAAMADGSRLTGPMIATQVDWSQPQTVCDVGGGTGRVLAELLTAHPHLRGVLFDLPSVVAAAGPFTSDVAGRLAVEGGDFFEGLPEADTMLLVAVLHDWGDGRASRILDRCASALAPGGRVLVVDQVLDPDRPPFLEHHADVLMMLLTDGGRERTVEDIVRLGAPAGLRLDRTWNLLNLRAVELVI